MGGDPSRVKVVGPLVPFTAGFRAELERCDGPDLTARGSSLARRRSASPAAEAFNDF